ncbi:MAG: cysteine desulfurase [Cardiobacteriaceae bacterium]|nr:cysteine desulfurase [Cardiobacteriaceae bacterium]
MTDWAYFDYAATTAIDEEIFTVYTAALREYFANSGAFYDLAKKSFDAIFAARCEFATAIGANSSDEIIWTSSATEANNLALKGVCLHKDVREGRLITVATEHKAVLDAAGSLLKNAVKVEILPPRADGIVDLDALGAALKERKTTLVSVMAVNNETGVVQPMREIADLAHKHGAKFHTDATQALGKIPVNIADWDCDLASFSGHKIFAPKGIGALFVRKFPKVRVAAQINGGGQERGMRAGTLPTALIIAFARACRKAVENQENWQKITEKLRAEVIANLPEKISLNIADNTPHCSQILSLATDKNSRELLEIANSHKIAIAAGSACTTENLQGTGGSYVLNAMNKQKVAAKSLRISLAHCSKNWEIERLINFFQEI